MQEKAPINLENISTIVEVPRCRSLRLASEVETKKIRRLSYTNGVSGVLALAENGVHIFWKWDKNDSNLSGEATTTCVPQLWQPDSGLPMINDLPESSDDWFPSYFCLSNNDYYIISTSGKKVTLYDMKSFKRMRSFMPSPTMALCVAFCPLDNNIIAIGTDDSTIVIYDIRVDKIISTVTGHSEQGVSSLAFSTKLEVLFSSGLDDQIVMWNWCTWKKKRNANLQRSEGWSESELWETHVQLDKDEKHILVVHETQLAVYETTQLLPIKQWVVGNYYPRISQATFSCDAKEIYAVMRDGIVIILSVPDLVPRFEIDPSAYLPPQMRSHGQPVVIAANPQKAKQFALGLSNGGVVIIEPIESDTWTAPGPSSRELRPCIR